MVVFKLNRKHPVKLLTVIVSQNLQLTTSEIFFDLKISNMALQQICEANNIDNQRFVHIYVAS